MIFSRRTMVRPRRVRTRSIIIDQARSSRAIGHALQFGLDLLSCVLVERLEMKAGSTLETSSPHADLVGTVRSGLTIENPLREGPRHVQQ